VLVRLEEVHQCQLNKMDQEQKTEIKKREATKHREEDMVAEAKQKVEKKEVEVREETKDVKEKETKIDKKPEKASPKSKDVKGSELKKSEISKVAKKTEAKVNGKSLPISTKHSIAVCNFIRGKDIDTAIKMLEDVRQYKRAVPMRGEIPHRKGIMSGRYPQNAVMHFVKLLNSLKSNAIVNEMEYETYKLFCVSNVASRPYRRFGRGRFKRTHVELKLVKNN